MGKHNDGGNKKFGQPGKINIDNDAAEDLLKIKVPDGSDSNAMLGDYKICGNDTTIASESSIGDMLSIESMGALAGIKPVVPEPAPILNVMGNNTGVAAVNLDQIAPTPPRVAAKIEEDKKEMTYVTMDQYNKIINNKGETNKMGQNTGNETARNTVVAGILPVVGVETGRTKVMTLKQLEEFVKQIVAGAIGLAFDANGLQYAVDTLAGAKVDANLGNNILAAYTANGKLPFTTKIILPASVYKTEVSTIQNPAAILAKVNGKSTKSVDKVKLNNALKGLLPSSGDGTLMSIQFDNVEKDTIEVYIDMAALLLKTLVGNDTSRIGNEPDQFSVGIGYIVGKDADDSYIKLALNMNRYK